MQTLARHMLISAVLLGLFAMAGTGLVAMTHQATDERIARNERRALLESLHTLIDPSEHDNDLFHDRIEVTDPERLGTGEPVSVYRAREDGEPVAVVLTPVAPDGYGGPIRLLVAVERDGTLKGVQVLSHHETPGLGDKIEAKKSDWLEQFPGRSLGNPPSEDWKVEKDGGVFDQFTGATVTPRAVVEAVYNTLQYYDRHRTALFERDYEEQIAEHEADESEDDDTHDDDD